MRKVHEIAKEIKSVWTNVHYTAKPYLVAMTQMVTVNSNFYHDTGRGVILRFLSNAQSWRGDDARRIKKELRDMLKK
jgi:hypothetical protein